MAMPSSKFPDLPGSGYPQTPIRPARRVLVQMSKEDQRRERNRQAQRKHRESVKQQLEKYDRLRQSLQHPGNDTNPSTHLADLRSGQQKFCPLPSAGVNPCMHPQSILPSLFPEVEVDQPIDPPSTEPNDPLSHRFLPSAGYAKRVYSSPSTVHDGDSSTAVPPSDTSFPLDPNLLSPSSEIESNARACNGQAFGRTLLHQGVIMNSEDIVSVLLAHVADVKAQDNDGRTPLHVAAALGYARVGRLLLMHGAAATVSMADGHGLTAMHLAVQNGHASMVEALVECGADINLRF
ncbi:Pc23g00530 [Penicillium rubens Wisconsin 54-1255]|uniref:Pc23g00530 protein n=1 Tax=Penicillium rubens (strain ATCC 28089 / DSM 1075 / NRRL 1951 / Wisconsin 54-1255) TaxID=500485 RepID=B6HWA4_PENRW|nr:Pc23g00530 [Penicillium rubens Wisconsin 54-1255]